MDGVVKRYEEVTERVAEASRKAGREPGSVRLLPVAKTWPVDHISGLLRHEPGLMLAENKVQEAEAKATECVEQGLDARWSIVGHLQRNKAKFVARFADELQTLDSVALARELQKRLDTEDRTLDVMIQVNTSGEEQKFGVEPDAALTLARELAAFDRLRLTGLMTVAIAGDRAQDQSEVAACFDRLVDVQQRLRDDDTVTGCVDDLSMGMSGDFELAIAHGATTVRVGTAIFGARDYT
ncbi:YggS family pyridoxal phosphate-dependent enzyme [Propioniferax innocua]|uniref:Pyridoxal phosphate homeostasis protein n=1 Tax=Propioniferax innocua TaxID=1753 RepID=A0A542ZQV2_9ACTN|nr:YggS family pyridoxal phosphate-dependent enzyme [Propioniferax innocua]TQL62707.1 hypothetical protein FB460_0493 [Propioniferax innocua]